MGQSPFLLHTTRMPFESKLLDELENMDDADRSIVDDHYHKKAFEEDPKLAYKASLTLIMAHVADFHTYILDCIARRYGHTREELVETIRSAPGWNCMYIHPVLKEFTHYEPLSSRKDILPEEEEESKEEEAPLPKIRRRKPKAEPVVQEAEPEAEIAAVAIATVTLATPKRKIVPKLTPAEEPQPKVIKKKKQVAKKAETATE